MFHLGVMWRVRLQTMDEPEILHESTGLTIKRNAKNRFVVATLYYYADPAKRKEEWIKTVKAGMTQTQWEKEYEISYLANFGERVFPELVEKRDVIVVPDLAVVDGPVWGGFDYGARNPSSFHVYTYIDGAFWAVWELYEPCKNVKEFARKIKDCPYYSRIKYIAADPTLFDNRTHNSEGNPDSVANLMIKEGITKFIRGNQDEQTWLASMKKHWQADDPTFKITESCRCMIKEFEEATYEDYHSDKLRQKENVKESVVDKNNHAMDDCKYFMNSQPMTKTRGGKPQEAFVDKWYPWGGQTRRGPKGHQEYPEHQQWTYTLPANRRKELT
jgi:hypothetical protein